jgi:DNA modification methylase
MIQEVLKTFSAPNNRVLVPFLGSGNTLLAAANYGMHGFGFDLSEEYRNSFMSKVDKDIPPNYKSYL